MSKFTKQLCELKKRNPNATEQMFSSVNWEKSTKTRKHVNVSFYFFKLDNDFLLADSFIKSSARGDINSPKPVYIFESLSFLQDLIKNISTLHTKNKRSRRTSNTLTNPIFLPKFRFYTKKFWPGKIYILSQIRATMILQLHD